MTLRLTSLLAALALAAACGRGGGGAAAVPEPCIVPSGSAVADTGTRVERGGAAGEVVVRARRQGSPDGASRPRAKLDGGGGRLETQAAGGDLLLQGVTAGQHTLVVSAYGHRARTIVFSVEPGAGVVVDVPLTPDCGAR